MAFSWLLSVGGGFAESDIDQNRAQPTLKSGFVKVTNAPCVLGVESGKDPSGQARRQDPNATNASVKTTYARRRSSRRVPEGYAPFRSVSVPTITRQA